MLLDCADRIFTIFDGDNTLWDTNLVFQEAQYAMLETLGDSGIVHSPRTQLGLLRELDRELIAQLGVAEYDFRLLARGLVRYFSHQLTVPAAATHVLNFPSDKEFQNVADAAYKAFEAALAAIPPLFEGAAELLDRLRAMAETAVPVVTALYSEGKADRIEKIVSIHQPPRTCWFDFLLLEPKTVEGFRRARAKIGANDASCVVVIGDSLKRDIAPARQTGCITIYKPSSFKGLELGITVPTHPDFVVSRLADVFPIIWGLARPNLVVADA